MDKIKITPALETQLGPFVRAARMIAEIAADAGPSTLAVVIGGSRGMAPERASIYAQAEGCGIKETSDLDMLIVVSDQESKSSLQKKIRDLACLRVIPDQGRATRRINQPPRREDLLELRTPLPPGYSREVDLTVLTFSEFKSRVLGVTDMFNECARGEDVGETDLAKHRLLCGFADSRLVNGTILYDPEGILAEIKSTVTVLEEPTARVLFERHIKVLVHLLEHVGESGWKNIFERASDQAIILDALVGAHYALNRRLCQPGYKNYPGDMIELQPDLREVMEKVARFSQYSDSDYRRLIAGITRYLSDYDRLQRSEPPISLEAPGFLTPVAIRMLLCLTAPEPSTGYPKLHSP